MSVIWSGQGAGRGGLLPETSRTGTPGSAAAAAAVSLRPPCSPEASRQSPEMASAAASAAAVGTLAAPVEQLRHLAVELRLLLPGVRGELTAGARDARGGLGRDKAGRRRRRRGGWRWLR